MRMKVRVLMVDVLRRVLVWMIVRDRSARRRGRCLCL
jgi:hypothetical protein